MKTYQFPAFALDPSKVWSEVPVSPQSTLDVSRAVSALTIVLAYMMSGNRFRGSYEDYTLDELDKELHEFCKWHMIDPHRVVGWAESLLLPVTYQAPLGSMVETRMPILGFGLHGYQRDTAEWMASRRGGVLALSCGTGKSVTAWAAAKAALRNKQCSGERCTIICPLNAVDQWTPYVEDLKKDFDSVEVLSVDSTHKYTTMPKVGGALIVDESHLIKSVDSARSANTFDIRLGYDWCACLTGTLLHTGPEGVLAVQDTAIPGLSRYTDKWKFGEAFNCIVRKKVGKRTKSVLAIPTAEHFDPFVAYLARGVRSLSFESPEVRASGILPGQTKHMLDTWAMPQWVKGLMDADIAAAAERLNKRQTDPEVLDQCRFFWLPDCDWRWALGATAVCVMNEIADLKDLGLDPDREPLPERLNLTNEDEDEAGLPTFAKVRVETCREGRLDRCVERVGDGSFVWRYAPGTDLVHPGPGVKIQEVMQWVDKHPTEPVLMGSVSSLSKQLMVSELLKRGKKIGVIDGTVPVEERGELVRKFQGSEIDYMVVQQVAGSTSITLTRAATSFLVDHSWSPIHYTQYLARTCRTSQTRECDHYDLVFGAMQMEVVRTLQRGEAFDVRARGRLEEMMREAMSAVRSSSSH